MTRARILLVGCGIAAVPLLLVVVVLGVVLFPGFGGVDSPYHPFRSAEAKKRYLAFYDARAERWPVPSATTTVESSYGSTFVRISGPADAPPLVLLHGAGGSSLHWIPNVADLSGAFRTYAVDGILGNGRSVVRRPPESADDITSWLDEVFTGLELGDDVRLAGLSYGGWQAARYALHFPERVERLVLLAPAGTVLPLSGEWLFRASLTLVPHPRFTEEFLFWLFEDLAAEGPESRRWLEREARFVYRGVRSFKPRSLVNPGVLTDRELRSLSVSTLFLVGENEKIYSARRAVERLRDVAPRVETRIVPDAGHDLTVVRADLVNAAILDFLDADGPSR